ncbi:MAG: FAD-dependent oxidoreductase [Deltaproteobacteria bacterium]|nr:FAD-dependent oxidoreductase [Deltaproteobacteria bacterium]
MANNENRYVIIGASAAGMAAAEAIRQSDSTGVITVLSEEPVQPYFRPMIPFLISGKKSAADMTLIGQGPYSGTGIDVRLHSRAEGIDTNNQTVMVQGGDLVPYDRLLIATGSRPYIPPEIAGTEAEGVFALRTLTDASAAAGRAAEADHVVMLGGGLLNLKAAFALLERGLDVTLVVYSPEVLSQLMEPDDAVLIRDALNKAGLKIMTGCSATHILSQAGGVNGVLLDSGQEISCQMVCIGKGVFPNVNFLEQSDVQVDQGVVVDRFTACNAANVFAAGDVAVTFDPITSDRIVTGLWTNAVEMGRCAGYNMAGRTTEYTGTFGILNATQVADEPFVSMGIVHTSGTDYETHVFSTRNTYRKLVFSEDGERLVGAVFIGDISHAGLYRYVIREKMDVAKIKPFIIKQTLHYGHLLLP